MSAADTAALLMFLCVSAAATDSQTASLVIDPPAFIPGVTTGVQMTCRPPAGADIARILSLQIANMYWPSPGSGEDVVVTYLTSSAAPLLDRLGQWYNFVATGSYDDSNPHAAFLSVYLPHPVDNNEGEYKCSMQTLDSGGRLHDYSTNTTLSSLYWNGSVPLFYQTILQELRGDLDTLNLGLSEVYSAQLNLQSVENQTETRLAAITAEESRSGNLVNDVRTYLSDADAQVTNMRAELERLHDVTPDTPVNFYVYLSPNYVTPAYNHNIVFNAIGEHSDTTSYSTSTGVFTVPQNGTYLLRTGVTGDSNQVTANIVVNDQPVASLTAYDDYNVQQGTACVVTQLEENDTVRVVKKTGSSIFGFYPKNAADNRITYFMGMLLW